MKYTVFIFLLIGLLGGCINNKKTNTETVSKNYIANEVVSISYNINNYFPHDINLFTEGLVFYKGKLFESSGSPSELPETESVIGEVDLPSGKFTRKISLDRNRYFGEGIVFLNKKLYQLTYKSQTAFIYDADTFKEIGQFKYKNKEGWGLTTDGKNIIMSDGTNILTYISPSDYSSIKTIAVTEDGTILNYLNELEFINGFIYANVWTTNYIVKIDPSNGKVVGKLDLSPIAAEIRSRYPETGVLNGIAYNPTNDKIYITGKMWPFIYEIEFNH